MNQSSDLSPRFFLFPTPLAGLSIVQHLPASDSRGWFERVFSAEEFPPLPPIIQVNHSLTRAKGTIRGLHFQYPPCAETKLVTCLRGEAFDVAVDVRCDSSTFLWSYTMDLTDSNHLSLLVPEGFAHGFQTLTADCEMLYLHTAPYRPESAGCLNALEPSLGILWPLEPGYLSPRDQAAPFASDFTGVVL